ncbi:MAG: gluconate 2-dehydrogenase subunit 3 family protein [Bacteroidota bacterium]
MNRRQMLSAMSLTIGGTALLSPGLFLGCRSENYEAQFFSIQDIELLNEIGETILPETADSPGAKAVKVSNFMDMYVAECYDLAQQEIVRSGLLTFKAACEKQKGKSFQDLRAADQHDFLVELDQQAKDFQALPEQPVHYFSLLKDLIVFAYFTSEEGAKMALRYEPIPGRYLGDIDYEEGEKAWAL